MSEIPDAFHTGAPRRRLRLALALAIAVGGCGTDEAAERPLPSTSSDTEPIQLLPAGWNEIPGTGQTRCGDGSPWAFFVRKGSVNRLVIELQGGGSCWSEESCFIHKTATTSLRSEPDLLDEESNVGIHDKDHPDNPVADWHHVLVSYCTGDLHWGQADRSYGERTFYHRGAVNVRAVLEWLAASLRAPEVILVTGHSAGGYGSILWAPWVAKLYPSARVVQLGDGGAGAVPAHVVTSVKELWAVAQALPSFIDATTSDELGNLNDLYRLVARGYPTMRLGQVSSAFDLDQTTRAGWYGWGDARDFGPWLGASLAELEADIAEFRSYRYPGSEHCIVPRAEVQTIDVDGARFRDWLAAWVAGDPVASVACGSDCGGPLVGDLGSTAEWACAVGRQPRSGSDAPTPNSSVALALHFARGPLALANVDGASPFAGLDVRACAAEDEACAPPLAQTRATTVGDAVLVVPTGPDGFDGYLLVTGAGAVTTRLYVWPPVRSGGSWFMNGHSIAIESPASLDLLLGRGGRLGDPTRGQVRVSMLDCARSFTSRAAAELDGLEPDTYLSGAVDWVGAARTPRALFANVEPGVHLVTHRPDPAGSRTTELMVLVEAGSVTDVIGIGPPAAIRAAE